MILQPLNHQLIETFFLLDKMSGFVNTGHQLVKTSCPIVENFLLVLLLSEIDDARWSVDFYFQSSVVDELCQELFGLRFVKVQQICHARAADASVIVGDDSDVL